MTEEEYRAYAEATGIDDPETLRCLAAFSGDDPDATIDDLCSCFAADDPPGSKRVYTFDDERPASRPGTFADEEERLYEQLAAVCGVELVTVERGEIERLRKLAALAEQTERERTVEEAAAARRYAAEQAAERAEEERDWPWFAAALGLT
jgi:hypothetical protein